MKRVIRFRAWDKAHECYLYDVQGAYDMLSGCVKYENGEDAVYDEECFAGFLDNDQYVVEQYTGLHDKNGREIYEGDIVHVWDNGVVVVIFDESLGRGQWMCKFKPAFPDWDEWSAPLYGWLEGNVDGSVFEILGNVYENPELMEVAKHE